MRLPELTLIGLGAEAKVYESKYLDRQVICKERLSKKFRLTAIDEKLRKERTTQEVRLLKTARSNGMNVPLVLDVDKNSWKIVMEKVEGDPIKNIISSIDLNTIFTKIGSEVGKMHNLDIIHGDLTTSNILVSPHQQTWLIDFGLGFISNQIEDKAVDLLVLKHTLESSHPEEHETAFQAFINGYKMVYPAARTIFKRMNLVETRVRYKTH